MAKRVLFSVVVGMFVMVMAGWATAGSPVSGSDRYQGMTYTEIPASQPGADPEMEYSNSLPWLERGPVETGSVPAMRGSDAELRCCEPLIDAEGSTVIRPGVDDGP